MAEKIKLYKHQVDILSQTKDYNKVAYYLDMGLGKTFIASEKAKQLKLPILVICQKSKIQDWENHFNKFYKLEVDVINYDSVWRRDKYKKMKDYTLILDESQYIKTATSKRTKYIQKLNFTNLILLSGTPVAGKYEELHTQIKLLGWNITKKQFWENYVNYTIFIAAGIPIKNVTGYKNIPHLKKMLNKYGAVFMKSEEALELPEQLEKNIEVRESKDYKYYNKHSILNDMIGDTPIKKLLHLRQLTNSKEKQDALIDIIESTEDRLIIFYNFKQEFEELKKIIKKNISWVNGNGTNLDAYNKYSNSITLVQYQSGASGLNLQKANKIIYYSLTLSADLYMQSKKRTHRIGQTKTCWYYHLLTGIELEILKVLQTREDYTIQLFEKG